MAEYRLERIGHLIQQKIGVLIVEGKIKDYRVTPFLSITRVTVSKDLTWADVYVSSCKTESKTAQSVEGLQSAAGFIQSQLAGTMRIRQTPKLRFHEDPGIREEFEMIKKIEALGRESLETITNIERLLTEKSPYEP
ncbi:MAG: 30S ribosome-binding factor RbfA [Treponema sp.]|jgi:ribosome-binding factor A|nr:30S ribosome-binding factor RbfA [Treponema sp.]